MTVEQEILGIIDDLGSPTFEEICEAYQKIHPMVLFSESKDYLKYVVESLPDIYYLPISGTYEHEIKPQYKKSSNIIPIIGVIISIILILLGLVALEHNTRPDEKVEYTSCNTDITMI